MGVIGYILYKRKRK
ncbi:hypothetical protein [Faecalibacillus intestinalis]|uniref:Uncharacterized protein n=1 Tax=Faecalibacillus intestinalis TaxID=1982626 RepID=A0AAW4VNF6_9FIRM|nr:hypothetical protein [Faecalibacillus intestinalis]